MAIKDPVMTSRAQSIEARLRGSKPPPWLLIHGDEQLVHIETADSIRAWLRPLGFNEREVVDMDRSFKLDGLERALRSRDLFAAAKLVELRFSAKPHKACLDWLSDWSKAADSEVCVMVSCGKLDRSQLTSAWFRDLQDKGWAFEAAGIPRQALAGWIRDRLTRESLQASDEVIDLIASRTEGNLIACAQEIKKLAMLEQSTIDMAMAQSSLTNTARWSAFDLQASCLLGDRKRALMMLDALHAEAEPPPLMLWALADAARQLLALHECLASGQSKSQAFRALRLFGTRELPYTRALERINPAQSLGLLAAAASTDRAIKGIGNDMRESMRTLVLLFTSQSRAKDRLLAAEMQ